MQDSADYSFKEVESLQCSELSSKDTRAHRCEILHEPLRSEKETVKIKRNWIDSLLLIGRNSSELGTKNRLDHTYPSSFGDLGVSSKIRSQLGSLWKLAISMILLCAGKSPSAILKPHSLTQSLNVMLSCLHCLSSLFPCWTPFLARKFPIHRCGHCLDT